MKKKSSPATIPSPIPKRWKWHYRALARLRERLIAERREHLSEAAEAIERHSMHEADSATDEFSHDLALSELSAEQDALYEVEAAMRRITDGGYGICEQTGRPIAAARLKAVPWTRFGQIAEAVLELTGEIPRRGLGTLRSVRSRPAVLAGSESAMEETEPAVPAEPPAEESIEIPPGPAPESPPRIPARHHTHHERKPTS